MAASAAAVGIPSRAPVFVVAIPAASTARRTASPSVRPSTRPAASAPLNVSPAPVESTTATARDGMRSSLGAWPARSTIMAPAAPERDDDRRAAVPRPPGSRRAAPRPAPRADRRPATRDRSGGPRRSRAMRALPDWASGCPRGRRRARSTPAAGAGLKIVRGARAGGPPSGPRARWPSGFRGTRGRHRGRRREAAERGLDDGRREHRVRAGRDGDDVLAGRRRPGSAPRPWARRRCASSSAMPTPSAASCVRGRGAVGVVRAHRADELHASRRAGAPRPPGSRPCRRDAASNVPPPTVSPAAGRRGTRATRSTLIEPTTMTRPVTQPSVKASTAARARTRGTRCVRRSRQRVTSR